MYIIKSCENQHSSTENIMRLNGCTEFTEFSIIILPHIRFFLFERDKWAFCFNKKPLSCRHASLSLQLKWSWKSLQKFQVTVAGRKVNWIGGALDICLRNYIMINWTRWHFHFVEAVCRDWLKRVKKEISLEASYEYWSSL